MPSPTSLLSRFTLTRILILGLVLRVAWVLVCPNEPTSDQQIYHDAAADLAAGRGYIDGDGNPAGYWPVGHVALLASFYVLFGAEYWVGYALNVILLLVGIAGIHELGRELFGLAGGRLGALIFALHPTFVLHATILASEISFCAGLPWLLLLFVKMARALDLRRSLFAALGAGALVALLVYVRPPALLLFACPPLFLWLERVALRRSIALTAVFAVTAFVVLVPWGVRNQQQFGAFSLTSFNGGPNFWMGNHVGSDGLYAALPDYTEKLSLPERDRVLKREAFRFIVEHPGEYAALCARRLFVSLRSDTIGAVWNELGIMRRFGQKGMLAAKIACSLAHWALLTAFVVMLFRRRKELGKTDVALGFTVGLLSVPFVFLVGGNRYMLPILPVLSVWVGAMLGSRTATRAE